MDFVQTGWNRPEGSRLSLVWVGSGQRCLPNGGKEGWKWWLQPRTQTWQAEEEKVDKVVVTLAVVVE